MSSRPVSGIPSPKMSWKFRPIRAHGRIADLAGNAVPVTTYVRGNTFITAPNLEGEHSERPTLPVETSRMPELVRRRAAAMARYRNSGELSADELRTIERLWVDGMSLRAHAREEGLTPATISFRVGRMGTRAVEFFNWWKIKHAPLRRGGRRRP